MYLLVTGTIWVELRVLNGHYLVLNEQQEDMYIRLKEQEQNEQDSLYTSLYTILYIILLYTLKLIDRLSRRIFSLE